jgi:hypothetical protein
MICTMATTNVSTIKLSDGREVCLSYGVPVAAFVPGRGYIKRDTYFSVTTSKHANAFAGKDAERVPTEEFRTLVAPVEVR